MKQMSVRLRIQSNTKRLFMVFFAFCLISALFGTNRFIYAATPDKLQPAAERMFKLHIITPVTPDSNDFALDSNLTRAELVTIIVRAFGQEENAKLLKGAPAFPDTANHWASGYVAVAKQIMDQRTNGREPTGLPNGNFNPDGKVTPAEAVAFLMKFVGAPKDNTLPWPDNYIQGAVNAGIVTAEDKAVLLGIKNAPATRGLAFYLADRTFYGYKLAEGGTVYTKFVDDTKPVLTVDAVPATTQEERVTITGTVSSDAVSVYVGSADNAATIANGKYTASVVLKMGENKIDIHAADLAGNSSEQSFTITRIAISVSSPSPRVPSRIEVSGTDVNLVAGHEEKWTFTVYDQYGRPYSGADVRFEVTGELNPSGLKPNSDRSDVNGQVTVSYVDRIAGHSGTIKSSIRNGRIEKSTGIIVVVAGEPCLLTLTPRDPKALMPGESQTFTIVVRDSEGNPVSNVALDLEITGNLSADDLSPVTTTVSTDSNGEATFTYTNRKPKLSGTIQATIRGTSIKGETGLIETEEFMVLAPEEGLTIAPNQSWPITFTVLDNTEKPVSGVVLELTTTGTLNMGNLNATTITTDENGKATVQCSNIEAGSGLIRATIQGTNISDTTGTIDCPEYVESD